MITTLTIYAVTIICLALLFAEVLFVIVSALAKERTERITFLRSFKKGKCAIIYITAIPLYLIGYMYAGKDFLKAFFGAVNRIINLVVLKYDLDQIELLMADNILYEITIYFCFALVGINALILVFSLTAQHLWEFFQSLRTRFTKKDRVFIFGDNEKSKILFKTDARDRNKTIIDKLDMEGSLALYFEKMPYVSTRYSEKMVDKILKYVAKDVARYDRMSRKIKKKLDKITDKEKANALLERLRTPRKTSIIINTRDDERNMKLCRAFLNGIFDKDGKERLNVFGKLDLYVYGDPRYEAIYTDIISSARGCFHYTNEYQKVALEFIDKYPITRYMDSSYIDYDTALIKDNVDINMILVGFGKTNQQIFLSSASSNVLVSKGNELEPSQKRISYIIFDKEKSAESDKNLNHTYYRFEHEMSDELAVAKNGGKIDYLPLPQTPALVDPQKININEKDFYDTIRARVLSKNGEKKLSYIVIAFGTDLENIDMAQKLVEKRSEWGIENIIIFVKARGWSKEQSFLEQKNCIFIGNDEQVGFNIEALLSDKWLALAQIRDALYAIENKEIALNRVSEALLGRERQSIIERWHSKLWSYQRESNIYACLNLRLKLNLMGIDYCKNGETGLTHLTQEDYYERYLGKREPEIKLVTSLGRPVLKDEYSLELATDKRGNLVAQEHLRWNAFMISRGFIPATLEQIRDEIGEDGKHTNGKSFALRRHGNLTTMKGLVDFRKIVSERDGVSEDEADVIKYDYQILNDAYWLLARFGYVMVDKDARRAEKMERNNGK